MPFLFRAYLRRHCVGGVICSTLAFLLLSTSPDCAAQPDAPLTVRLLPSDAHGWMRVEGRAFATNAVVEVQASSNLVDWATIAVLHGADFEYVDPGSTGVGQRFYRFEVRSLTGTNDWKNQLAVPYDPFYYALAGPHQWVKFAILADDPTRVYFADTHRFTFHYDFASERLEPFSGMSPAEFDAVSQFNANRAAILGTVLVPGYPRTEYGIQFVSRDALEPEMIRDLFELVKSAIVPPRDLPDNPVQAFYIPTFEQMAVAQGHADYFASNGIPISSVERWIRGDVCYSQGWAVGTLKFFTATNVAAAYTDGRLGPQDILVTDGIPAELPYVSGLVTLAPATANSHVAILAQSYGVPFAYLFDQTDQARLLQWTNREIALQTGDVAENGACQTLIQRIEPALEGSVKTNLFALRHGGPLQFTPKESFGAYTAPTDSLLPADIRFFGGKAANYGLLRRVIPSNAEPAIAISFDLWDAFMSQSLTNGMTLRQEISNRLAGFTYPPNVGALQAQLGTIRGLIRNAARFTPAQEQSLMNALGVFDSQRNIRFRSSTNVEDADSFTGAGLYDSYSGCLLDDQDGDAAGPSACDPTEEDERGVFRALRRVYASFYNDNAFLERLRLGVDENKVGMAALVHHSTPDEFELANGVATGRWSTNGQQFVGTLVSQLGAISVANPDGTALPEQVSFNSRRNEAPQFEVRQNSSLVRRGETVMSWTNDYFTLINLLRTVAENYARVFPDRSQIVLDIEYKKVAPGVLEVKQVRPIPLATNGVVAPFVLNDPDVVFASWHGFYDDIFLAHRLKSRWSLHHRNVQFSYEALTTGFFTEVSIEYLNGTNVQVISGPLDSFPNFTHTARSNAFNSMGRVENSWTLETVEGPLGFTLHTQVNGPIPSYAPFTTLASSLFTGLDLEVQFSQPTRTISPFGPISYVTNIWTRLYPLRAETSKDLFQEKHFDVVGQGTNIQIHASYWLPEQARGDDCRCPILRIVESRIEGFTTQPLVLRGYWSQTFDDIHHSDYEQFLFEPRLDSGVSPQQLSELAAADIAQIYVNGNGLFYPPVLLIVGLDGRLRRFSDQDFPATGFSQ